MSPAWLSFFLSRFPHISECFITASSAPSGSSKHLPPPSDFGNVISLIRAFDVEGFEGKKHAFIFMNQ